MKHTDNATLSSNIRIGVELDPNPRNNLLVEYIPRCKVQCCASLRNGDHQEPLKLLFPTEARALGEVVVRFFLGHHLPLLWT